MLAIAHDSNLASECGFSCAARMKHLVISRVASASPASTESAFVTLPQACKLR